MPGLLEKFKELPIGFGGGAVSGEGGGYSLGAISERDSISLLQYAFEKGIKIFDTAPIYGFGTSEKRMGKAFKDIRDQVFIVSKCGVTWHENQRVNMTNDPQVAANMLEDSLRRLETDYIDLYMIHWPDQNVDIRRPMEVLSRAKNNGKIKHIGLSNTNIDDLNKATEIDQVEVVQSELNLFKREVVVNLFKYLEQNEISFMSWGTLDKGILTGRVDKKRTFERPDSRAWAPWWKEQKPKEKIRRAQRALEYIQEQNHTGLELALGHNLMYPQFDIALCGPRSFEQVDSIISALEHLPDKSLIEQALERIDE